MSEITELTCKDCGDTKPVSEFYKQNTNKTGYRGACKICHLEKVRRSPNYVANYERCKQKRKLRDGSSPLSRERLMQEYKYDPATGQFARRKAKGRYKVGEIAGTKKRLGRLKNSEYIQIEFMARPVYAHRLAFLYMTGEIPEQIDHINGDGTDNSWANLRSVDGTENQRNIPLRKANKTGIHGVRVTEQENFQVTIGLNNKTVNLGIHADFFEACCVRKSAENKYGFHANHGRKAQ